MSGAEQRRRLEDPERLWARTRDLVRPRVGEANFSAWIEPLRVAPSDDGLALEACDGLVRQQVARHFLRAIEEALAEASGRPARVVLRAPGAPRVRPARTSAPDERHTFASFVVGDANVAAHARAHVLIDGTDRAPLLMHGPSGVGKTHLLHAIGHALEDRGLLAGSMNAADLLRTLGQRGTADAAAALAQLRALDALLLDDLPRGAGAGEAGARLAEGLAAWGAEGRILVLTSDADAGDPAPLAGLARVRIDPPEPALRLAILTRKAQALGLVLDTPLAARIAAALDGNVRRLEGALVRLLAHARLLGQRVDEALALRALPELTAPALLPVTLERIVAETAAAFGARVPRLRGRSRTRDLVLARQVAMYLARKLGRLPFAEVATAFSRNHTTAQHAFQAIAARLTGDEALAAKVDRIEQRLRGDSR